jgi:3-hydroxybutyryl-CoA dehydratase
MTATNTSFQIEHTLTQRDFDRFAELSGDDNPIHVDPAFCAGTRFGGTLAHGMLLYTVLWGLIQRHYPGARQVRQSLMFPAGTYAGQALHVEITAMAAVGQMDEIAGERAGESAGDRRLDLATRIRRAADGVVVCDGTTEILWPGGNAR